MSGVTELSRCADSRSDMSALGGPLIGGAQLARSNLRRKIPALFPRLDRPPRSLHQLGAHQNGGDDTGLIAAHAPGMIGATLHENLAWL